MVWAAVAFLSSTATLAPSSTNRRLLAPPITPPPPEIHRDLVADALREDLGTIDIDCDLTATWPIDAHAEDRARIIAREAGVAKLGLTHLLPEERPDDLAREATAEYDGEVIVARDGMTLEA